MGSGCQRPHRSLDFRLTFLRLPPPHRPQRGSINTDAFLLLAGRVIEVTKVSLEYEVGAKIISSNLVTERLESHLMQATNFIRLHALPSQENDKVYASKSRPVGGPQDP